jgi:hypothetical protein
MVVNVNAQKPKQTTAAIDEPNPAATHAPIVTTVARPGHMNW